MPVNSYPDCLMRNLLRIQNKSALFLGRVTIAIRLLGNNSSCSSWFSFWKILSTFVNMAFITDVREFQALLDACVSVRNWETLTESIQIPKVILPMAYARLTELTLEEIEVSFIFHWLVSAFHSI